MARAAAALGAMCAREAEKVPKEKSLMEKSVKERPVKERPLRENILMLM